MSENFPLKLSLFYVAVASLWILFSDSAVAIVFADETASGQVFGMLKGLGFVFITGLMLYGLVKREIYKRRKIAESLEEESTQHNLTRQKFSQKERIYKAIIDSMDDIVFTLDKDQKHTGLYGQWVEKFNMRPELFIGRTATEVMGTDAGKPHMLANQQALATGKSVIYEWFIEENQVIQTRLSPLYDSSGVIQGLVGVGRDVTAIKRTKELEAQARLLEVELEQERDSFGKQMNILSLVSHEFRTPLSIIRSSNSLLERYRERMTEEQFHTHTRQIDEQVLTMVELMEDVLNVEKLRRALFRSDPQPLNLRELTQTVIQQVRAVYQDKAQHFTCGAVGDFEEVTLDSRLTRSILTNLLTNAAKYSPPNSTITCHLEAVPEHITIQITDNGIGIPEADRKQLFEPFHRAENAASIKGTGLGLVIVKQSVEAQNGTIQVETAENQGTTFTITLPRHP